MVRNRLEARLRYTQSFQGRSKRENNLITGFIADSGCVAGVCIDINHQFKVQRNEQMIAFGRIMQLTDKFKFIFIHDEVTRASARREQ